MKVILVNGGPHERGCTYMALNEVAKSLQAQGVETEFFWAGAPGALQGSCRGCGFCRAQGRCVLEDGVNRFAALAEKADGFVFGSPVHFAAPCGDLLAFMGRLFYSAGRKLAGKPAASVVSCRRGGATAALDAINKFYPIMGMPMVPSQYWNMVHGIAPQDVLKDEEGLQIMRNLGVKMAWMLRSIQAGRQAGVPAPVLEEPPLRTNFIR